MNAASPFRPPGQLDLATALAPYRGPWNARLASHLARRAGFGATPVELRRLAALSPGAAVDSFVHFADTSALPAAPTDLPVFPTPQQIRRARRGQTFSIRPRLREIPAAMTPSIPLAAPAPQMQMQVAPADPPARAELIKKIGMLRRQGGIALQTWWLQRMLTTPAPLQEKMTLFWHGHFTTAYGQKGISPQEALAQNQLFRTNALGNVHALTLAVAQDPAMLKYLDNARNIKEHPNENFARELMELFTLGIGNYTEQDVRESARAFTGWTVRPPFLGGGFVNNTRQHDDGVKTFLGRSGNFDGTAIVDIIFQQPAASKFFASKLLNYFVYNDPEPQLVDAVAGLIRRHNFEMAPVVSTILRSNLFFSDRAYRSLVKSPVEFVVGALRLFGAQTVTLPVLAALSRMGQMLFIPPSVKGWDGGTAWLNTQTVLTRENFASALMSNAAMMQQAQSWIGTNVNDPRSITQRIVDVILQGDVSPASMAKLVAYFSGSEDSALPNLSVENIDERLRGGAYLAMAMPAYQLN